MEITDPNPTQSEVPSQEALTEFERSIRWLSELNTDRAMRDMAKMTRVPDSVRSLVETMALGKPELMKALRHMNWRERALQASLVADRAMSDFIKANPNYEIDLRAK